MNILDYLPLMAMLALGTGVIVLVRLQTRRSLEQSAKTHISGLLAGRGILLIVPTLFVPMLIIALVLPALFSDEGGVVESLLLTIAALALVSVALFITRLLVYDLGLVDALVSMERRSVTLEDREACTKLFRLIRRRPRFWRILFQRRGSNPEDILNAVCGLEDPEGSSASKGGSA